MSQKNVEFIEMSPDLYEWQCIYRARDMRNNLIQQNRKLLLKYQQTIMDRNLQNRIKNTTLALQLKITMDRNSEKIIELTGRLEFADRHNPELIKRDFSQN